MTRRVRHVSVCLLTTIMFVAILLYSAEPFGSRTPIHRSKLVVVKSANFSPTPFITTLAPSSPAFKPDRYVMYGRDFYDGRRLGNQISTFAVILYVSELTGRLPAILNVTYRSTLEETFDLQVPRHNGDLCPCHSFKENRPIVYDSRVEDFAKSDPDARTISMGGYYQSWKYTRSINKRLRRHLVFLPKIRDVVDKFMDDSVPNKWIPAGFIRVGIHVRRGDVTDNESLVNFGFTTPNETYFERAMQYIVDRFQSRVQFIVVSNDLDWCRKHLEPLVADFNGTAAPVSIVYSVGHSASEDMAVLASCDHVIMSTGSYGWWGAWLAGGMTIYYADWPRPNTNLWSLFRKDDWFPPWWIGMV